MLAARWCGLMPTAKQDWVMKQHLLLAAAAAAMVAAPVEAQTTSARDRIAQILGNLLGVGNSATNSLDGQWTANRRPLANQRIEFEARVDAEVRAARLSQTDGARLKADYYALVQLEAQYGEDRTFTAAERSALTTRYNELLQVLVDGRYGYGDNGGAFPPRAEVSEGQAAFNARVDAAVSARRITRTAGTRLKNDYAALIRTEANYLRDGALSETEREDLDARLDALDERVGDVAWNAPASAKARLDAIFRALPTSGLSATARAQLLVEHGDLVRLEAAYARLTPTAEERAYLESRIANLETRARVRR
jgi:hypothetical protein